MDDYHDLVIEPVSHAHNRSGFSCGVDSLDDYLRKRAKQDIKRRISRVFVATRPAFPAIVTGYYTLRSACPLSSMSYLSTMLENCPDKRFLLP